MNSQIKTLQDIRYSEPNINTSIEIANLLFIDIETSGLRPDRGANITELSILNRNSQLLYWKADADKICDTIAKELAKFISHLKEGVIVGHNLQFDFWFITYECDRIGLEGLDILFIDTLSLARKVIPERNSYKLSELLKYFEIKVNGELHTATADTEATRALFWKLVEKGGIATVGEAGMKKLNWSSF